MRLRGEVSKKVELIVFSNLLMSKHPVTRVERLTSVPKTANVTIVFVFYICVCDWVWVNVWVRESYDKQTCTHAHLESFSHLISSLTGFCCETFGSPEDANWRPRFSCYLCLLPKSANLEPAKIGRSNVEGNAVTLLITWTSPLVDKQFGVLTEKAGHLSVKPSSEPFNDLEGEIISTGTSLERAEIF